MSFLCLSGKGTKVSKYLINHDKEYIARLKLGIRTVTCDIEGKILEEREVKPDSLDKDKLNAVLRSFIGEREQIPPQYSAIKINRKKTL